VSRAADLSRCLIEKDLGCAHIERGGRKASA
jgi:hypothetical protein